jgi:uncharacterized protein (DUF2235 family)
MKRLVFCFDGTWNTLDAPCPTNVVLTAESVLPLAPDNIAQVVFYDQGVGTAKFEWLSGGMFGAGLVKNMADGYRFLIFNYTPGDEIYVFGFSRGAYTARSFVGLLHASGILQRGCAHKVDEAIELYRSRETSAEFLEDAMCFRRDNSPDVCVSIEEQKWRADENLDSSNAPLLEIKYLGVWDTVGALGIPSRFAIARLLDKKYLFHDMSLSPFVKNARHALAIDERRKDFVPTLWDNTESLNASAGVDASRTDAPYQQKWFPGVHGSVGGGGERRGLSDQSMDWVLDGARAAGLVLDSQDSSRIFELKPDYTEFIANTTTKSLYDRISAWFASADRKPGPATIEEVSVSAQRRWLETPQNLKDGVKYRPATLDQVKGELEKLDPAKFGLGAAVESNAKYSMYQVKRGDTLTAIAMAILGSAKRSDDIFKANLNKLDSPDRIYPGQMLRIPKI